MFYTQAGNWYYPPTQTNTTLVQATPGLPLVITATGLGSINPPVPSGTIPVSGTSSPIAVPPATINGSSVQVLSATYTGLGIYAITVDVPDTVNPGTVR